MPASFAPHCRALVLGSFPSEQSLAAGAYYANPRNWFWSIAARALGDAALAEAVLPARASLLLGHGVALWDVWASCERSGSLDSAIQEGMAIDLASLLERAGALETILLNGGEAAAVFSRVILPTLLGRKARTGERPDTVGTRVLLKLATGGEAAGWRELAAIRMPSSSPVPSARFRTLEDRLAFWVPALASAEPRGPALP